jgi:hypothetical protein
MNGIHRKSPVPKSPPQAPPVTLLFADGSEAPRCSSDSVALELSSAPGAAFGLEEDPGEAPVGAAADPGGDSRGSVPRPGAQDAGSTGGTCKQTDFST